MDKKEVNKTMSVAMFPMTRMAFMALFSILTILAWYSLFFGPTVKYWEAYKHSEEYLAEERQVKELVIADNPGLTENDFELGKDGIIFANGEEREVNLSTIAKLSIKGFADQYYSGQLASDRPEVPSRRQLLVYAGYCVLSMVAAVVLIRIYFKGENNAIEYELECARKAGKDEGYKEGHKAGYEEGRKIQEKKDKSIAENSLLDKEEPEEDAKPTEEPVTKEEKTEDWALNVLGIEEKPTSEWLTGKEILAAEKAVSVSSAMAYKEYKEKTQ